MPVTNDKIFTTVIDNNKLLADRLPQMTKDNIVSVGTMIMSNEFTSVRNEFINTLFDKVGLTLFNQYQIKNPLAKFIKSTDMYGGVLEEITVDIVQGEDMTEGACNTSVDPFVRHCPRVVAEYHKSNKPRTYPITINRQMLAKAFLEETGLNTLLTTCIQALYNSAEVDDFYLTKMILAEYVADIKNATLPLLNSQTIETPLPVNEVTAAAFMKAAKNIILNMSMPNSIFNPQKITKQLQAKDLTIFLRTDVLASIDIDLLRSSFQATTLNLNVDVIPFDLLPDGSNSVKNDKVFALICEKDFLYIRRQYEEIDSIKNPRNGNLNTFLKRESDYAVSYSKDCVIFKHK